MSGEIIRSPQGGSVDLPRAQWRTARAAGQLSFYEQVAEQAASAVCGLYGKSPSSYLRLVTPESGLIDNNKGLLDDLCQDVAPPPAEPEPPFAGGQCDNIRYRIDFTVTLRGPAVNGNFPPPRSASFYALVWGTIADIRLNGYEDKVEPPFRFQGYKRLECICRGDGGLPGAAGQNIAILGSSSAEIQSIDSLSVVRADGQPDTCGNPLPVYPPPSTDPNDYDKTILFPISPTVNVPVNVKIAPTVVVAPLTFRPELNVNVGGINVNISAGGFTFSPTTEIPVGTSFPVGDPRTVVPDPVPIPPSTTNITPGCDLTPVLDRLNEIDNEIEECCDRYYPYQDVPIDKYTVDVLGEGNSGDYDLPAFAYRVVVQVLEPDKVKRSQAGLLAPDVVYAGWAWFDIGGGMAERMPIDSVFKAYEVPQRSDARFAFTMQGNVTAKVTVFRFVKDS